MLPSSTQAQAQLEAELALFSFDPAPHPPPPTPVKVYFAAYMHPVATNVKVSLTGNTAIRWRLAYTSIACLAK